MEPPGLQIKHTLNLQQRLLPYWARANYGSYKSLKNIDTDPFIVSSTDQI